MTDAGRRALAAWLQEPGDGPVLEFEQLLKINFADSGRWVEWAWDVVEEWPDDVKDARFDVVAGEEGVRLAESISTVTRASDRRDHRT